MEVEGRDRQVATCLSTSHRPSRMHECARTGSPRSSAGHQGVGLLSFKVSKRSLNTRPSTGSHCFQTYSLHGHCCCIARLPRPTISSEWLSQMQLLSSPGRMIKGSGSAFASFSRRPNPEGEDHTLSFTSFVIGSTGLAQRSQDQRLSFLGQLGGRTPDDPCQTPRGRIPFCWGVGGCSGGPFPRCSCESHAISQGPWVSSKLGPLVPVQQSASLTNLNQAGFGKGGSTKLLPESNSNSETKSSSNVCLPRTER